MYSPALQAFEKGDLKQVRGSGRGYESSLHDGDAETKQGNVSIRRWKLPSSGSRTHMACDPGLSAVTAVNEKQYDGLPGRERSQFVDASKETFREDFTHSDP